jgi:signal peptidase II|tara:strand:+ start:39 stop:548 length:510 start_codon:yes stop_codon:yes gene_type:complete
LIDIKEIKNNILKKENCYLLAIILLIFGLDRYSKIEIINNFSDTSVYLNDFLNFDLIWNTGIGFGLLKSNTALFYNLISILIGLVVIILFFLALRSKSFDKIIYSIIIGGALGNFYDRVFYNAVPDFIDIHYRNFHWFTFNIADIFITVGIIALIIYDFFKINKNYEKN